MVKVKTNKKTNKKAFKTNRKKRGVKKATVKEIVKMEIARNIENKNTQLLNLDVNIASVATGVSVFPLTPLNTAGALNIVQGDAVNNRNGNQIKTKSLMFKGTIYATPYNAISNSFLTPLQVKMWIFYAKDTPTVTPSPGNDFFQVAGANSPFQNDIVDLWVPINTDKYRVLATKTFKIGYSQYGNNGSAIDQFFCNNDFKYNGNFSFNLTKHMPQFVKWDDTTAAPKSRGLWALVVPLAANGGGLVAGQTACRMSYMLDYTYEDA